MARTTHLELQRLAAAVRHRPLGEVALLLGYQPDPTDRSRWRREGSVITVTGMKFYDHLQGVAVAGRSTL